MRLVELDIVVILDQTCCVGGRDVVVERGSGSRRFRLRDLSMMWSG